MSANEEDLLEFLQSDEKLCTKFLFIEKLGQGCFGSIFKVRNLFTNELSALKIQYDDHSTDKRSTLLNEIHILKRIGRQRGIPKLKSSGKWNCGFYLQIELLQSSLHDEKDKEYTITEISKMAKELILILKKIHDKQIVHQDLKPQNIMRDQQGNLLIIDFGLSCPINFKDHRRRGFIGTPRYASISAHKGKPQAGKDDIESLIYVLAFLYSKKLPWRKVTVQKEKKLDQIARIKEVSGFQFLKSLNNGLFYAYQYVRNLKRTQMIDYAYLISVFMTQRSTITNFPKRNSPRQKRKSDGHKLVFENTLFVHYTDKKTSEVTSSNQISNYSEMAQDNYIEYIQILTEKILSKQKRPHFQIEETNLSLCEEPKVNVNISKYFKSMIFKNPFLNPPT